MVFSSTIFTFGFLPIVLVLYYIAKEEYRNYILLAASLLFYAYGEPKFVYVMVASIIINYAAARMLDIVKVEKGRRALLIADIAVNIGILFLFKYLDFSISIVNRLFHVNMPFYGIVLPIGISFFTFQALSYVVDVYRREVPAQKNIFYVALYIALFPQLVAGPIVRYNTVEAQIRKRSVSMEKFGEGAKRFMLGFAKKILLANQLAVVAEQVFACTDYKEESVLLLWIGAICFSLQIFYDFSGYSDMAIGLGKMFGFTFEENFRYPYISGSATEFWRRWHISLGSWFRDYVYIPLGGSRVSGARHLFNLFVVWLLTGIWHGANTTFIVWGLLYFVMLVMEKFLIRPWDRKCPVRVFWRLITLLCIIFEWIIFNSPSVLSGMQYIASMLGLIGTDRAGTMEVVRICREYGIYMLAGIVFAMPVSEKLSTMLQRTGGLATARTYLLPVLYLLVFLWATSFLILGAHNPFIYFNF